MPAPFPPPILSRRRRSDRSSQPTEGPVEFYEQNGIYTLRIEMPGFEPENITAKWHDGTISVSTKVTSESGQDRTYHRAFWTPKEVDPDTVTAQYRHGVLRIKLPIAEEGAPYGEEVEVT